MAQAIAGGHVVPYEITRAMSARTAATDGVAVAHLLDPGDRRAHRAAMSVQKALMFLSAMRRDAAMRSALLVRQDALNLDDLCAMARAQGLVFNTTDLQSAFRTDWALRALRRQRGTASTPN